MFVDFAGGVALHHQGALHAADWMGGWEWEEKTLKMNLAVGHGLTQGVESVPGH